MNTSHTATPYRIDAHLHRAIVDTYGNKVAEVATQRNLVTGTTQGNAEFIVRACNAHDDLVKALQDIVDDCADASPPSYGAVRQAAKAALAKAGVP